MHSLFHRLISLVLPATCFLCRADLPFHKKDPVCQTCQQRFHPFMGYPERKESLDSIHCAYEYKSPFRELIHSYKYQGKENLTEFMGGLCQPRWNLNSDDIDAIVPVPMALPKKIKRNYNPPELMSQYLGSLWRKPVVSKALKRKWISTSQTGLTRKQREKNAGKLYQATRQVKRLENKRILLVDDVMTTGSTLQNCAQILREKGVISIVAATLAYDMGDSN